MRDFGGLLRRHGSGQPRGRAQDGDHAKWGIRCREHVEQPARGTSVTAVKPPGTLLAPRLEVRNMSKRFGALQALDDVSLTLRPATVHALLGENGAGKSTLVKCIMGFYRADQGDVSVGDARVSIENPKQAQQLGVGMVYQHFTLVENMSVAENL